MSENSSARTPHQAGDPVGEPIERRIAASLPRNDGAGEPVERVSVEHGEEE